VEYCTNINKESIIGETPLLYVSLNGNISIVKCLVEHGADINKINSDDENTLYLMKVEMCI